MLLNIWNKASFYAYLILVLRLTGIAVVQLTCNGLWISFLPNNLAIFAHTLIYTMSKKTQIDSANHYNRLNIY